MTNQEIHLFPTLTTDHLLLRALLARDGPAIHALRSDKTINKYLDRPPTKTLDDSLNFIKKIHENAGDSALSYWGISLKADESIVGTICLFSVSGEPEKCEIGYELLPGYQRKGIMREAAKEVLRYAFQTRGLQIVDACTHRENQSSINLLLHFNFVRIEMSNQTNQDLLVYRLSKESMTV